MDQVSFAEMERILKKTKLFYNETELSSSDLDGNETDYTDSDTQSESVPSETSEDRNFVVSDTDQLSYLSDSSSRSYDSESMVFKNLDQEISVSSGGLKIPIKTIAQRVVSYEGRQVTQNLVLWYSWEATK
ncbi:uncharacterized protein N7458_002564 [Penicillium daleae]|uniref:Uncharacterized protein n=1 Tax=Penicillium daleae TaxID=63821 RepID=A0AAD6CFE4_9EURO|nr:uncharacterized protein N7458_002564 [Penicillium daleae]KAJ5461012.1 hypothetical protein N7458_002564 [Penicillium daleae]